MRDAHAERGPARTSNAARKLRAARRSRGRCTPSKLAELLSSHFLEARTRTEVNDLSVTIHKPMDTTLGMDTGNCTFKLVLLPLVLGYVVYTLAHGQAHAATQSDHEEVHDEL